MSKRSILVTSGVFRNVEILKGLLDYLFGRLAFLSVDNWLWLGRVDIPIPSRSYTQYLIQVNSTQMKPKRPPFSSARYVRTHSKIGWTQSRQR